VFERAIKRLVKKYPSVRGDLELLITELAEDPHIGTALGQDCYKVRMVLSPTTIARSVWLSPYFRSSLPYTMSHRHSTLLAALLAWMGSVAQFSQEQILYRSPTANVLSVQAVDINGDGHLDMLTGTGRGVFWAAGNGLGSFAPPTDLVLNDSYEHLATAGDVDGDGDMDVIYARNGQNIGQAFLMLNHGGGQFSAPLLVANNGWPFLDLAFHDMDLDGDLDLVAGRSNGVHRFFNLGNGVFGSNQVMAYGELNYRSYDVGDIDGDGYPDLVVSFDDGQYRVKWYRNDSTGVMIGTGTTIASAWSVITRSMALADVDGDGDLDVLNGTIGDGIRLYRNDGTGGFPGGMEMAHSQSGGYQMMALDMDGDGDADMVHARGPMFAMLVFINEGDGTNWTMYQVGTTTTSSDVFDIADLDDDGDLDLVYGKHTDGQVGYVLNAGDYTFPVSGSFATPFGEVYRVYHADLNGDGSPDIVASTRQPDAVVVGLSSGPGAIGEWYGLDSVYSEESRVAFADVDNDGDMDMFRSSKVPKRIDLYLNDGTGHFTISYSIPLTYAMEDIATGDIDGDGDQDLMYVRKNVVTVGFYRNNGDGTAWTERQLTNTSNLEFVNGLKVLDLDGDGDLDIAVHTSTNSGTGQMRWLKNNGNWSASYPYPTQAINGPSENYVDFDFGDLDGDNDLDVLSAMSMDAILGSSKNNGTGTFTTQPNLATYSVYSLRCAALVDVDGDGDLDAVRITTNSAAEVAYHANDGNGNFSPAQILPCTINGAHWMEPFDFDGDGDMDLLIGSRLDQAVFWMENFFGSPYRIEGRVYYDVNNNGLNDPVEPGFPFVQLTVDPYGGLPFTLSGGSYDILCDTGTYTVGHATNPVLWQLSSDSSTYTVQLDQGQPVVTGIDFGFLPAVDSTLAICSSSALIQVCGDTIPLWTTVSNRGSTILRGLYHLSLDTLFTFVSAEPPPIAINDNTITWQLDSVFYYDHWQAELQVITPDVDYLGDTVRVDMQFEAEDTVGLPLAVFNGSRSWVVACAYDPNIKTVEPRGFGASGAVDISTEELVYTVHFQNTGTAPAQLVLIRDELSPLLDLSSFALLGTSHTLTGLSIGADRELVFRFDNIMLPDSGADQLGSQGFVRFLIKPYQPVFHGTMITNSAAIHFDLNPAIITDIAITTFVDCSGYSVTISGRDGGVLDSEEGAQYQWFFNSLPIPGATGRSLFIEANGWYTVQVTSDLGCVAMSDPYQVVSTGEGDNDAMLRMVLFPVPAKDRVRLVSKLLLSTDTRVEVWDVHGRLVSAWRGNGTHEYLIERGSAAPGIHFVRVLHADGSMDHGRFIWE
jgi:hypothetical protein